MRSYMRSKVVFLVLGLSASLIAFADTHFKKEGWHPKDHASAVELYDPPSKPLVVNEWDLASLRVSQSYSCSTVLYAVSKVLAIRNRHGQHNKALSVINAANMINTAIKPRYCSRNI